MFFQSNFFKKSELHAKQCRHFICKFKQFLAYSGDPRSLFPVISVHFLFIFSLSGVKLILFS